MRLLLPRGTFRKFEVTAMGKETAKILAQSCLRTGEVTVRDMEAAKHLLSTLAWMSFSQLVRKSNDYTLK